MVGKKQGLVAGTRLALPLLLAWSAAFTGAAGAQDAAAPAPKEIRLGGIVLVDSPWGDEVVRGMQLGAAAAGAKIDIKRHHFQFELEREYIHALIAEKVDALVVVPQVEEASGHLLREARKEGIPVVCIGICLTERDTAEIVDGFYESDNYELGYRTGTYMAEWIFRHPDLFPPGPHHELNVDIGIIHSDVYAVSYRRGQGFRQALIDSGVHWQEKVSLQGIEIAEAHAAAQKIAREYPDIHLIWTDNSENTLGALEGLHALPPEQTRHLFHFGTEINAQVAGYLLDERNIAQAVTGQVTCKMAKEAILAAVRYARGEGDGSFDHIVLESRLYSRDEPEEIKPFLPQSGNSPGERSCS